MNQLQLTRANINMRNAIAVVFYLLIVTNLISERNAECGPTFLLPGKRIPQIVPGEIGSNKVARIRVNML